jgi:hypothetical protein
MELFLPGLLVLLVAAFFIFLVLPRMGPMVLGIISIVALLAAGIHHYNMFHSEYALSTWQYGLAAYAPWVVLALAFVFILAALSYVFGGGMGAIANAVSTPMEAIQNAVQGSANVMPPANTATNPVTAAINTGLNAIVGTNAPNVAKPANRPANGNRPANKPSPLLPGLNFPASQI